MNFRSLGILALLTGAAQAQSIPAPKLELIDRAIAAMKIDARIQGLVDQRVEARVRDIRLAHPDMTDSAAAEIRALITAVHAERMEGPGGLMPRVRGILDRRLTEEDLRFVSDFRGSDQGRRYREMVPRIVNEALDAGREWEERLEPEIRRRLEGRVR
jgi:hypothetical protein